MNKKLLFSLFIGLFSLIGFGYGVDLVVEGVNGWENGDYMNLTGIDSGTISIKFDEDLQNVIWRYSYNTGENVYNVKILGSGGSNCNVMSSLECQINYSLIPISDVDSSYCINNGLCPTSGTGDIVWSNLYINDILHVGSPSIFIDIPEEFNWDYEYYTGYMNVNIEGYNVDSQYIEGIIDSQKYVPSDTDFNKIITDLIPKFIPGIVIILCLYFIFRFIKKVF